METNAIESQEDSTVEISEIELMLVGFVEALAKENLNQILPLGGKGKSN